MGSVVERVAVEGGGRNEDRGQHLVKLGGTVRGAVGEWLQIWRWSYR